MGYSETILRRQDSGYPGRLRDVRGAPETLWVRGAIPDADRVIAVVGARAARASDLDAAHAIARELARAGAVIVSGGAIGVDAASHRGALDSGHEGATAAVLGSGLDVLYPERNRALFDAMCEQGGGLVSEFPPDAAPRGWHFVQRNHTLAGMADAVLVIAATARSGSLHTARAAHALGRVVAARPGSPGCEALLAAGAAAVHTAEDLWNALAGQPRQPDVFLPEQHSDGGRVLACLTTHRGQHADELAEVTGLGVRQVSRALTSLELDGLAILLPGRNYVRSTLAQTLLAR